MFQNTTVKASSELVCENLASKRVQPGVPRPIYKIPDGMHNDRMKNKQTLLITSLNIRGKQYSNKKSKYKDLMTLMRQRKIALIAL